MPVGNEETNMEEEKKVEKSKVLNFDEELAELVYGDKKKAGNMQCYSFYFDEKKWSFSRIFSNEMSVRNSQRENHEEVPQEEMNMQAAKEGRLFVVSDKAPYLQKVTIEAGKVKLVAVNENPIRIPEGLSKTETKAWQNLKSSFDNLVKGNTAETHWGPARAWRNRRAQSSVSDIIKKVEQARKDNMREAEENSKIARKLEETQPNSRVVNLNEEVEREVQEEAQPENVQTEETHQAEEVQQAETQPENVPQDNKIKEESRVEQVFDQSMDFVRKGNFQEAAAIVAQEMNNLSQKFNESKYMEDKAIHAGMEMRRLMETLKKRGSTDLLDALEKNPEFKENKNIYQGQQNLAEFGKRGKEAREWLKVQEPPKTEAEKNAEKNALLDILAGEYASSLLIRKELGSDISRELKKIGKNSDVQKMFNDLKAGMEKTNTVEDLMMGTPKELHNMFSNDFIRQRTYNEAFSEVRENRKKQAEKAKELQKEKRKKHQKENEKDSMVLSNQDKRMSSPGMGGR